MSNEWDLEHPRKYLTRTRALVLIILAVSLTGASMWYVTYGVPASNTNTVCEPGGCGSGFPCTFSIYIDGSNYDAAKCIGGGNSYKETKLGTLFNTDLMNDAACTSGCKIYFTAGLFTVDTSLKVQSNVYIDGSGIGSTTLIASATYTQGGAGEGGIIQNPSPSNSGVANVTITNLSINGNEANRGALVANDYGIEFNGAVNSLNKNIIIDHVNVFSVFGTCITGRYVQGFVISHFFVRSCSQAGQGGIYHGIYFLRSSNGEITDGVATSMNDGSGIKVGLGGFDILVEGVDSTLNAKDGFELGGGSGVDFNHDLNFVGDVATNNTMNGFEFNVNANGEAKVLLQSVISEFNKVNGIIANNVVNMRIGESVIMDNSEGGGGWQGLRLFTTDTGIVVVGNRIGDDQATKTQANGILTGGNSNLTISSNDLRGNSGANFLENGSDKNVTLIGNLGYNPIGKSTNFVTATPVGIAPWGASSTVVASTTYVVNGANIYNFTSSGGTGVVLTIKDTAGNCMVCGAATITAIRVLDGDTISFGAFSVAPTVKVYFE